MKKGWEWRDRAACRGSDTDLFFGPPLTADGRRQPKLEHAYERRARIICNGEAVDGVGMVQPPCPVREDCLAFSMPRFDGTGGEVQGVWGGYSGRQRRAMLQAWRRGTPVKLAGPVRTRSAPDVAVPAKAA